MFRRNTMFVRPNTYMQPNSVIVTNPPHWNQHQGPTVGYPYPNQGPQLWNQQPIVVNPPIYNQYPMGQTINASQAPGNIGFDLGNTHRT